MAKSTAKRAARPSAGKGRAKPHNVPLDLEKIESMAHIGLSLEQIAVNCKISVKTLYRRRKQMAEVTDAIKRGLAMGELAVANAIFQKARNGHVEAAKFYLAARCGWAVRQQADIKTEVTGSGIHVHLSPLESAL